ncbi:MAG TPA: zinc-ribbon domain containing protein [Thermoanaerobaculia bacterium]|nr:zinc-ribbon domain containing protein [Thermoanaerobaculia bacterium]
MSRKKPKAVTRTRSHPLFGNIPLIEHRVAFPNGKEVIYYEADPNYEPPLPPGAIRGNVRKQRFCGAHNLGKYFYVDEPHTCVQCNQEFIFFAKEQRFWYEMLGFHLDSRALRCLKCRKQRRSENALRQQIGAARKDLRAKADDPRALLDLASASVRLREREGHGDLNEAIGAARKAGDLWRDSPEPLFWEAKAQQLAGREQKAAPLFSSFLERARKVHRLAKLVAEAESCLAELRV